MLPQSRHSVAGSTKPAPASVPDRGCKSLVWLRRHSAAGVTARATGVGATSPTPDVYAHSGRYRLRCGGRMDLERHALRPPECKRQRAATSCRAQNSLPRRNIALGDATAARVSTACARIRSSSLGQRDNTVDLLFPTIGGIMIPHNLAKFPFKRRYLTRAGCHGASASMTCDIPRRHICSHAGCIPRL